MLHPNLHPPLVHFPIALSFAGLAIEIFSFLGWRQHPIRSAARWMILLGTLASVLSLTSGIYALNQAARIGIGPQQPQDSWRDVAASSPLVNDSQAWSLMVRHVWLQSAATAVLLMTVVGWITSSDQHRRRWYLLWLIGLLTGAGLIGSGAYFSGEAVYTHSVGIQPAPTMPSSSEPIFSLAELHLIGAGMTIALSMLSIGLCGRANTLIETREPINDIAAALGGSATAVIPTPPEPGAIKVALFTGLVAVLTAAGGWWLLASDSQLKMLAVHDLWQLIRDPAQNDERALTRRLAHVIGGGAIILMPLALAVLTRWLPRRRTLRGVMAILLVLFIASQLWLGVLLLYDSNSGPITRFQSAQLSP